MTQKTLSSNFSLKKKFIIFLISSLLATFGSLLSVSANEDKGDEKYRDTIQQILSKDPYGISPEHIGGKSNNVSPNSKGGVNINKNNVSILIEPTKNNFSSKIIQGQMLLVGDNTDVLTQAIEGGVRQFIHIKSKKADNYYDFSVNMPSGYSLVQNPEGVVAILREDKSVHLLLAEPWALDADRNKIETYYTIEPNNILRQHVKFNSKSKFPIVADPTWCGDFIQSTSWIYRGGTHPWSLSVNPTACGRLTVFSGGGFYVNDSWEEMLSKTATSWHWDKSPGTSVFESMYYQYACHANFVMLKDAWNLEPTRPNVGYLSTVAAGCNPN